MFPLPRMEDCIDQEGSATYASNGGILPQFLSKSFICRRATDGTKEVQFVWSGRCRSAFEKAFLCAAPVLAAPRLDEAFFLRMDASNVRAGAVFLQVGEHGGLKDLWLFVSRKFNAYQLNYSVIEKEGLALIWAMQHFVYLGSDLTPLVIYMDHNPLTFLRSLQNPNQRLMRCFYSASSHQGVRERNSWCPLLAALVVCALTDCLFCCFTILPCLVTLLICS